MEMVHATSTCSARSGSVDVLAALFCRRSHDKSSHFDGGSTRTNSATASTSSGVLPP